jgi:hypothetical protein
MSDNNDTLTRAMEEALKKGAETLMEDAERGTGFAAGVPGNPLGKISSISTRGAAKSLFGTGPLAASMSGSGARARGAYADEPIAYSFWDFGNDSLHIMPTGGLSTPPLKPIVLTRSALAQLFARGESIFVKPSKPAHVDKRASTALAKEEALNDKIVSQAFSLSALWDFIEERGLMAEAVAWCDSRDAAVTT